MLVPPSRVNRRLLLRDPLTVISFCPLFRHVLRATSPLLLPAPEATPGASRTRSAGLRPFKGSSSLRFESTVVFRVGDRLSTCRVAASTVTVSDTLPISSATSTRIFSLAWSRMFRRSFFLKPGCSTVKLYEPTGSSENTYPPLSSVNEVRVWPVAMLVILTLAPGITADCESVIVPNRDAVSRTWPKMIVGRKRKNPRRQDRGCIFLALPLVGKKASPPDR